MARPTRAQVFVLVASFLCHRGQAWLEALELLRSAGLYRLEPDVVSYGEGDGHGGGTVSAPLGAPMVSLVVGVMGWDGVAVYFGSRNREWKFYMFQPRVSLGRHCSTPKEVFTIVHLKDDSDRVGSLTDGTRGSNKR